MYYPSISEKLLTDALNFARQFTEISVEEERVIMHARKSLLFNGDKEWVKKNKAGLFDVTMGSFDGAEICELVGTYAYALASLPEDRYCKKEIGLYRDDGLMVHRGTTRTAWDSEIESPTSLIKLHQNEWRSAPCGQIGAATQPPVLATSPTLKKVLSCTSVRSFMSLHVLS